MKLWLAFRDLDEDDVNAFTFHGVFSTREMAVAACTTLDDWITEEVLDDDLNTVNVDFEKCFPLRKAVEAQ